MDKIATDVIGRTAQLLRFGAGLLVVLLGSMLVTRTANAAGMTVATGAAQAVGRLSAVDAGPVAGSQPLHVTLALKVDADRTAALDGFLASLIDSSSSSFHQWVTPAGFASAYGASAAQIEAATAWAEAQGLSVEGVSAGGTQMVLSGTAQQVQAAFSVSVHSFVAGSGVYVANVADPTLDAVASTLFAGVTGLDTLPLGGSFSVAAYGASGVSAASNADALAALIALVDANASPVVTIDSSLCSGAYTQAQVDQFRALFRQAAAQGMTVLASSGCGAQGTGSFPGQLPEVTSVASVGAQAGAEIAIAARPTWQVASGFPADALRYEPDVTASSVSSLAQTLSGIVQQAGVRQGVVTANLYKLASTPGLYTQPDNATAGTWEAATGLGVVDLHTLTKVYPRGTGASFISFSATTYSPIHGQPTTFSSSVTSGTGGATPTGTVSFMVQGGATLGTASLVNGNASFTINTLAGGTYNIYASYSGDTTYGAATTNPAQIVVQPEPSSLSATVSGQAVIGGNVNVIVTDTASSGVGQPSGTVSVSLPSTGSTYSGTLIGTTANAAAATISFPAPAVGTITLNINCTTSASFSCYNQYVTTATIVKATPTLTISYNPNPPVSGATITLNASVSTVGTAPAPTGAVVFSDNSTVLNSGLLSNGTTTTTGIVSSSSSHSISATYNGDANYNTVTVTGGKTTAGLISTTTSLVSSATTVPNGQPVTLTATVTPASNGSSTPSGAVQFYDGTTLLGTATLNTYVASLNVNTLSTTTNHSVTAIYIGDTTYATSTSNTVAIAKTVVPIVTTVALTSSAGTVVSGATITFTASVNAASSASAAPSGTVQFYDGSTLLGTATLSVTTTVTFSTSTLSTTVNHSITAVYSGDTNYAGSTSPVVTITKATTVSATTTTLSASPTTAAQGTLVTLSASVGPTVNSVAPTGTVQFLYGGSILCTSTLTAGVASCSTVALPIGTDSITAVYLGDTNYTTSTSTATTVTISTNVAINSTLIASISPAVSVLPGATATITAILNSPNGLVPSGSITATITGVAGAVYSTVLPGTVNTSTLTVTIPVITPSVAGTYSVVVACNGSNFACLPVTLSLVSSTTAKIATTTVLTSSAASVAYGTSITLTAVVTPASTGAAAVSGTVIFYDGSTAVGTGTLTNGTATGTATITATSNSLTAVYSGDTNYASSTSAPVVVTSAATPSGLTLYSNTTTSLAGYDIVLTAQIVGTQISGTGTSSPSPTGTVVFYDTFNGVTNVLGTATVASSGGNIGVAGFSTTGLTVGTHSIYGVYSGDKTYSTTTSTTITISETDFSVAPSYPASLTVVPGGSGTVYYLVSFLGGFQGSVNLSCVPPSGSEITCSFNPSQVSYGGGPTTLTVTTTAATARLAFPLLWQTGGGVVCAGLLVLLVPGRRRRLPAMLALLLAACLMPTFGCGNTTLASTPGAFATSGTPRGTTTLTIKTSGTDGVSTINHLYSYTVNIQ